MNTLSPLQKCLDSFHLSMIIINSMVDNNQYQITGSIVTFVTQAGHIMNYLCIRI